MRRGRDIAFLLGHFADGAKQIHFRAEARAIGAPDVSATPLWHQFFAAARQKICAGRQD
jgi:hypothetical protein